VGRQVEGIGDALIVMGTPEPDARRCEEKVQEGWILISVSSHNPDELRQAKEIMETNNAQIAFTTAGPGAKIPQPGSPMAEPSVIRLR
jgi:hypothetical protein